MSNAFVFHIRRALCAFSCLIGISVFFIFSSNLSDMLGSCLKVHSSYTGGEIVGDFMDASGDDHGAGGDYAVRYPSNGAFEKDSLDLIRYTVHEPVIHARWQKSPEYWQLDLAYKGGSEAVRTIMIYIDLDNVEGGSVEPLFNPAENVSFDSAHPWDFAVLLSADEGKVFDSAGAYLCDTELYVLQEQTQLKVRIPLQDKKLQKVFGAKKTWHAVLTAGRSQFDSGMVMPVEERASMSRGGLEKDGLYTALIPNVYDVLGDNACLASWSKGTGEKAVVVPVEVSMEPKREKQDEAEVKAFIEKVTRAYDEAAPSENADFANNDEALAFYGRQIKEHPDDYVSMARYGSSLAVKGGESSAIKAMALVNEAYGYLDRAAELACNKDGEINVLMNRGSVSAAVPQQVFGKAESGAEDFMRVVSITDDQLLKAYCYTMAYSCYRKCGKDTQALLALQEARLLME